MTLLVLALDQAPSAAVCALVATACHGGTSIALMILTLVREGFVAGRLEACRAAGVAVLGHTLQIAYYGAVMHYTTRHEHWQSGAYNVIACASTCLAIPVISDILRQYLLEFSVKVAEMRRARGFAPPGLLRRTTTVLKSLVAVNVGLQPGMMAMWGLAGVRPLVRSQTQRHELLYYLCVAVALFCKTLYEGAYKQMLTCSPLFKKAMTLDCLGMIIQTGVSCLMRLVVNSSSCLRCVTIAAAGSNVLEVLLSILSIYRSYIKVQKRRAAGWSEEKAVASFCFGAKVCIVKMQAEYNFM